MRPDFILNECLRQQFLFKSSGDDTIELANNMARVKSAKAGGFILLQGDSNSPLVLLLEGQLRTCTLTEDGREIPVRTVGAGEAVGAVAVVQDLPSAISVAAIKPSMVALINRADAHRIFSEPGVARRLNVMLASLIQSIVTKRTTTGSVSSTARVCGIIHAMFLEAGVGVAVELPTHASLATLAQVSRETVTRVLALLARREIVVKQHRRICIKKPEVLQLLATGSPSSLADTGP